MLRIQTGIYFFLRERKCRQNEDGRNCRKFHNYLPQVALYYSRASRFPSQWCKVLHVIWTTGPLCATLFTSPGEAPAIENATLAIVCRVAPGEQSSFVSSPPTSIGQESGSRA